MAWTGPLVWIAIRRGIYRHEVLGVFPSLEDAEAVGLASVNAEHDHYHDVEILESVVAHAQTEEQVRSVVSANWSKGTPTLGSVFLGAVVKRNP